MLSVTGAATLMRGRSAVTLAAPASPAPVLLRNDRREMPEAVCWGLVDRLRCFTLGPPDSSLWTRVPSARPGDVGVERLARPEGDAPRNVVRAGGGVNAPAARRGRSPSLPGARIAALQ